MSKHLEVLEKWLKERTDPLSAMSPPGGYSPEKTEAIRAAIALMRGQSEVSRKVEPAPNWCRTCGRRPNDPLAVLCSDSFHIRSKQERDDA